MTIEQALKVRHTVRKYLKKPLNQESIDLINERINALNEKYDLSFKLITNDNTAIYSILKLFIAKNVNNYIVLASNKTNDDETIGYAGSDIMLYIQTLGLNTWWVGSTFNHTVRKYMPTKYTIGIIAVGYGANKGKYHKSKRNIDVSKYEGDAPEWFTNGIDATLYAPTSLNKQDYFITGSNDEVTINVNESYYQNVNKGIVKYHFEIGAGKENFKWVDKFTDKLVEKVEEIEEK